MSISCPIIYRLPCVPLEHEPPCSNLGQASVADTDIDSEIDDKPRQLTLLHVPDMLMKEWYELYLITASTNNSIYSTDKLQRRSELRKALKFNFFFKHSTIIEAQMMFIVYMYVGHAV